MNKFMVRDINAAPKIEIVHEDMGLCYVSKFTIGIQTIYSICRQQDNPNNYGEIRAKQARDDLHKYGYEWDGVL